MLSSATHARAALRLVTVVAAAVYGGWLGMLATHEAGHVLHAWLSGGRVTHVEFPLFGFSRTDLSRNPHPLFVAWGGAIWGCLLPAALLGLAKLARLRDLRLAWFFLGFCLLANGVYLAVGLPLRAGDAADLVRLGAPQWSLVAFGTLAIPAGLLCWHQLGRGLGLPRPPDDRHGCTQKQRTSQ